MRGRTVRIAAAAAAAAGVGAAGAAALLLADGDGAVSSPRTGAESAPTAVAGPPAPRLRGPSVTTGEEIALADFRGKPVVLHVWASWCSPCERGAGALRRLARRHEDVVVLGLALQDTEAAARRWYAERGWQHPSIADPSGRLAARLGVAELPTTYFLSREHRIVTTVAGPAGLDALERGLEQARSASSS